MTHAQDTAHHAQGLYTIEQITSDPAARTLGAERTQPHSGPQSSPHRAQAMPSPTRIAAVAQATSPGAQRRARNQRLIHAYLRRHASSGPAAGPRPAPYSIVHRETNVRHPDDGHTRVDSAARPADLPRDRDRRRPTPCTSAAGAWIIGNECYTRVDSATRPADLLRDRAGRRPTPCRETRECT